MPTALITHPACLQHDTGPYHPECPDRLRAVLAALEGRGIRRPAARVGAARDRGAAHPGASRELRRGDPVDPPRRGRDGAARRRHGDERRQRRGGAACRRRCGRRGGCGDGRLGTHRLRRGAAAGSPCRTRAADGVLPVQQRRGGGAARAGPVGRAARRGGGFRRASRQRHAGDVRRRSRTCSTPPRISIPAIRAPARPASAASANNIVNAPLRPGSDGAAFRAAWSDTILPELDRFAPGLLIVSAGFDAHKADPLAQLRLETADYRMDHRGADARSPPRIATGGWSRCWKAATTWRALAASAAAHVRGLMLA